MSDYNPNFAPKKTYYIVGQKAVLTNQNGKILLLKRSEKAGGGGLWSLPGGALDEGEDPQESIKREIKEETGLEVRGLQPFAVRYYESDGERTLIVGYKGEVESREAVLNWEHDDYRWLEKEEALRLDLTEDAKFFIKNL